MIKLNVLVQNRAGNYDSKQEKYFRIILLSSTETLVNQQIITRLPVSGCVMKYGLSLKTVSMAVSVST